MSAGRRGTAPPAPACLTAPLPCRCDEQILPAVYAWVGASFNATPTQLGTITLGRAMMQALSSPLGGVAGTPRCPSRSRRLPLAALPQSPAACGATWLPVTKPRALLSLPCPGLPSS